MLPRCNFRSFATITVGVGCLWLHLVWWASSLCCLCLVAIVCCSVLVGTVDMFLFLQGRFTARPLVPLVERGSYLAAFCCELLPPACRQLDFVVDRCWLFLLVLARCWFLFAACRYCWLLTVVASLRRPLLAASVFCWMSLVVDGRC